MLEVKGRVSAERARPNISGAAQSGADLANRVRREPLKLAGPVPSQLYPQLYSLAHRGHMTAEQQL